jgi:integrase
VRTDSSPRTGKHWNKYFILKARKQARLDVRRKGYLHIPFWEALFEYLLATTSRRSEALSLTWAHTYLDDKVSFYPDTKNGRSRSVPLRQHVVALLKQLPRDPGDDRVFPITGDELDGSWARICKRAGIRDYHIHDNRHEGLSAAAEAGRAAGTPFDVIALSRLSGHRDLRMLARYSHLCAGELAERLDEAYELAKQRRLSRKGRPVIKGNGAPLRGDRDSDEAVRVQPTQPTSDEHEEREPLDKAAERLM